MRIVSVFLALVVGTISAGLLADDDDRELQQIRRWVMEGRILPLQQILDRYPARFIGRLLDLEVEQEDSSIVYELEFLRPDGRVMGYRVDARSGKLLELEERD